MSKSATDNFRREDNAASEYLVELGARVRAARARHGMTRKILANDSGVSERYLAKLESGQGNVSVLVLRQIADAMDMKMSDLIVGAEQVTPERQALHQLAQHLPEDKLAEALGAIRDRIGESANDAKGRRLSLIGLRGAGKSTLGPLLAGRLGYSFIELNKQVEREFGASLGEIFSLAGQPSFRRLERRCLATIIDRRDELVIATGGSIVADEKTFSLLLRRTHVIWLQASPEEHMARVMAQGDMRPMAGSREAMEDLKQILAAREPLYRRADARFSTAGQQIEQSLQKLEQIALSLLDGHAAQST